jgi:hypothetical protein
VRADREAQPVSELLKAQPISVLLAFLMTPAAAMVRVNDHQRLN